jgi:hypothetical protein
VKNIFDSILQQANNRILSFLGLIEGPWSKPFFKSIVPIGLSLNKNSWIDEHSDKLLQCEMHRLAPENYKRNFAAIISSFISIAAAFEHLLFLKVVCYSRRLGN